MSDEVEVWLTSRRAQKEKKYAAAEGPPTSIQRTDDTEHQEEEEKERCSGSYRLAVGFLVIKDESISERPG